MSETVIVFRDKKAREIRTYINLEGHGASMPLEDFVSLMCELYGPVWSTMSAASLAAGMQEAAQAAVRQMKKQTGQVAAINMEPAPQPHK
jgi:hypothetical protein